MYKKLELEIKKLGISHYVITNDGVNIIGNFQIPSGVRIKKLPFKIDVCYGNFNVSRNDIESLENFPNRVLGDFHIGWNNITSLSNGPKFVGGDYYCYDNPIKTNYSNTEIIGRFHTTLAEEGLEFINHSSFVTKNYNNWRKLYNRKFIINKIIK